jgi:hypothetical protein
MLAHANTAGFIINKLRVCLRAGQRAQFVHNAFYALYRMGYHGRATFTASER